MTKLNGHDDQNIHDFPSAAEREALKKAEFIRPAQPASGEPVLNLPPMVKILCIVNILVFLPITFFPETIPPETVDSLGFVPSRYFQEQPVDFSAVLSPLTHMFLHAGWLHIGINIGSLMAFGAGLEKIMGARRLLLFYLVTGLCGALLHLLAFPESDAPMVGASGAISGLFGGILMMMYDGGLMGQGYKKLLPFIVIWIGISLFFGFFGAPGTDNPVAWTAHVGGFIGGLLLYRPVCRLKLRR